MWADLAVGQLNIVQRKFDDAVKAYRKVIEAYPNNTQAQIDAKMGLANALKEEQRYDEALAAYRDVEQSYADAPQTYWAIMGIAQIKALGGDFEGAAASYREAADRFPQSTQSVADSKLNLANLLRSGNRIPEALKTFEEIVKEFPGTTHAASALQTTAQIYTETGQPDRAREVYQRVVKEFADRAEIVRQAQFGLAGLNAEQGQFEQAVAQYNELLTSEKSAAARTQALQAIAQTHLAKGDNDAALETFDRMLDEAGGDKNLALPAKMGKGTVFLAGGKYQQARDLFLEVAAEAGPDPMASGALQSLAQTQLELGHLDEVEKTVEKNPGVVPQRSERGDQRPDGRGQPAADRPEIRGRYRAARSGHRAVRRPAADGVGAAYQSRYSAATPPPR
ncbi:MAG: tetratricopeptide repeat protein [Deltaproteobacteria bacterium]|nr:tetratricopeptide repeat protein [Deltaproteobacteria bacterium]